MFSRFIKHIHAQPLKEFYNPRILREEEMPAMWVSISTALLPVILIGAAALVNLFVTDASWKSVIGFVGQIKPVF